MWPRNKLDIELEQLLHSLWIARLVHVKKINFATRKKEPQEIDLSHQVILWKKGPVLWTMDLVFKIYRLHLMLWCYTVADVPSKLSFNGACKYFYKMQLQT